MTQQAEGAVPQPLIRCLGIMGVLFLTLSVTTPASSSRTHAHATA